MGTKLVVFRRSGTFAGNQERWRGVIYGRLLTFWGRFRTFYGIWGFFGHSQGPAAAKLQKMPLRTKLAKYPWALACDCRKSSQVY